MHEAITVKALRNYSVAHNNVIYIFTFRNYFLHRIPVSSVYPDK